MAGPDLSLKIANLFGDVSERVFKEQELPEPQFQPRPNPVLENLLRDPELDPSLRAAIRGQLQRELREQRIHFDLSVATAPEKEDPSIFSKIFGIPVGFQIGTYLGVQEPITRFLADLIIDPINLIAGVGGLTKLGRAARFLGGLSPAQKADALVDGARVLGNLTADASKARELQTAIQAKDFTLSSKLFKELGGSIDKDVLAKLVKDESVDKGFVELLKNPHRSRRELKRLFALDENLAVDALASNKIDQILKGQRGFVNFGVPFTDVEVASVRFAPLIKAFKGQTEDLKKAAEGIAKLPETAREFGKDILVGPQAKGDAAQLAKALDVTDSLQVQQGATRALKDLENFFTRNLSVETADLYSKGGIPLRHSIVQDMGNLRASTTQYLRYFHVIFGDDVEKLKAIPRAILNPDTDFAKQFFASLNDTEKAALGQLQATFKTIRDVSLDSGLIRNWRENYFPRAVTATTKAGKAALRLFQRNPEEFIKSYGDPLGGTRHGLNEVFKDIEQFEAFAKANPKLGLKLIGDGRADVLLGEYFENMGRGLIRTKTMRFLQEAPPLEGKFPFVLDVRPLIRGKKATDAAKEGFTTVARQPEFVGPGTIMPKPAVRNPAGQAAEMAQKSAEAKQLYRQNAELYDDLERVTGFQGFKIHKSVSSDVGVMFGPDPLRAVAAGSGWDRLLQSAMKWNSIAKASLFNLNPLFHSVALAGSLFATLPPRVAASIFGDVAGTAATATGEAFKSLFKGSGLQIPLRRKSELVLQMMSRTVKRAAEAGLVRGMNADDILARYKRFAGVSIGRPEIDTGYQALNSFLREVAETVPAATRMANGISRWNDLVDFNLWGIVLDGFKFNSWVHIRHAMIERAMKKGANVTEEALRKIDFDAGQAASKAFGGLNWELYFKTPAAKQIARFAFLAPDWTLSNLLMGRDLLLNIPAVKRLALNAKMAGRPLFTSGDILMRNEVFHHALQYNTRAFFYALLASNAMNWAFTYIRDGEGKFLHEMGPEAYDKDVRAKTRIQLPYDRPDGRRQYMDITKQFKEPLKMFFNPPDFFKNKSGVFLKLPTTILFGVDSMGQPVGYADQGPYASIIERIAQTTQQFSPIFLQQLVEGVGTAVTGSGRPLTSSTIGSAGFSIRSEPKKLFDKRQRIARLKRELELSALGFNRTQAREIIKQEDLRD